MKCELVPSEVSQKVPFLLPSYIPSSRNVNNLCGCISKNGSWIWLVNNTAIDFYNTGGEWCGGHNFEETLKNPYAKIIDGVEFTSTHLSFPAVLVAVNQDHDSLICIINANTKKVVRVILVPESVTAVDVVSGNGGACLDTHHLNSRLRYMFGIVAIGTVNGHIYFLDLCLDENFSCSEELPNITTVLSKQEFTSQRREIAISKKQHIFMRLNDRSIQDGCFELQSRSNTLGRFPCDDVFVTALQYIRGLATLAVGFSFGGIQLWNLQDLSLQFTISTSLHEQPVISFAFQEPENDPRNFCYLWIFSGPLPDEIKPKTVTVATLYSFTYYKREYVDSFGTLYTELQSCNKRFEYPLMNDPFKPFQSNSSFGTRLISCQALHQTDISHTMNMISRNESESLSEDTSLCFFSWEVWFDGETFPSSYHLAVFDLNQWYQAQMPFHFRCDYTELSPYMAIYSLEAVAQNLQQESILGVHAVPQSIKKFKFLTASEEFFYPSSLSFCILCFTASGLSKAAYCGFQRHLLFEMAELGPQILINPKDIYSSLIIGGLVDTCGDADAVPLLTQRETLLQLALEYQLPYFFVKCLKEWRYSDSVHECCTSRALLNWAWKSVKNIKNSIDRLSLPLFNCCGSDIDISSLKHLHGYRRQLNLIDTLISAYQKYVTPRTEQGIQDLQCRKDVVTSINLYLQVLLWLQSVHILPEVCEGDETERNIFYPVNILADSYSVRRKQLQSIHSSIGSTDILLIDGLIEEAVVSNTWQEKGGTGTYPPPSIYAAISCYLVEGVSTELIHALLLYLLLDIQNFSSANGNSTSDCGIKKFSAIFGMSQSIEKLIEAFWFLDRQDFEEAINRLLDPAIKTSDILPWQHQRIIKSFLYSREPQKALKYIDYMEPPQNSVEEMKLYLSVLLSHGAITRAFYYQRRKQNGAYGEELLTHLFRGCQEMHKMKDILYMPLNVFESSSLVKYLSENEDLRAQEILVIYYLKHCNFFEAARVNERLSRCLLSRTSSMSDRTVDRNALVESLLAAVPKAEKRLVEEIKQLPFEAVEKADALQPLSLSLKRNSCKAETYSDIIHSLMCRASSTMKVPCPIVDVPYDPKAPFKARSGSRFEDFPFLRPPVTSECIGLLMEPPSTTPVMKRNLSINCNEYLSPTKKSRLLDNATFKVGLALKRSIPKHLAGDVASLLQTPPIHRKSHKFTKSGHLQSTPIPQSILKKPMQTSKCMEIDSPAASTASVFSKEDEVSCDEFLEDTSKLLEDPNTVEIENHSRQIRFEESVKDQSTVKNSTASSEIASNAETEEDKLSLRFIDSETERTNNVISKLNACTSEENEDRKQKRAFSGLRRQHLKEHIKFTSEKNIPVTLSIATHAERSISVGSTEFLGGSGKVIFGKTDLQSKSELIIDSSECFHEMPTKEKVAKNIAGEEKECVPTALRTSEVFGSSMLEAESVFVSATCRSFVVSPRRPLRQSSRILSQYEQSTEETAKTANIKYEGDSPLKQSATNPVTSDCISHECSILMDSSGSDAFLSPSSDFNTPISSMSRATIQHFSSISKSSDMFENNELRKESLNLLKEEELFSLKSESNWLEIKPKRSVPTKFVFGKTASSQNIKTKFQEKNENCLVKNSGKVLSGSKARFLRTSGVSETFEEFSSTLKNRIPDSGKDVQACVSSPTENVSKEALNEISKQTAKEPEENISQKAECSDMKEIYSTSSITNPRASKKKTKAKDKISRKMEFSFAEPHSPAGPEILEALSSPPDRPVPTFMFSPPLTRGRLRQKKLNETVESSFASVTSESSFQGKKPPVDSILEKIMQEKTPESKSLSASSIKHAKSIKKKILVKKARLQPVLRISDTSILDESSVHENKNISQSSITMPSRHSMVLRQAKVKKKLGNISFSALQ